MWPAVEPCSVGLYAEAVYPVLGTAAVCSWPKGWDGLEHVYSKRLQPVSDQALLPVSWQGGFVFLSQSLMFDLAIEHHAVRGAATCAELHAMLLVLHSPRVATCQQAASARAAPSSVSEAAWVWEGGTHARAALALFLIVPCICAAQSMLATQVCGVPWFTGLCGADWSLVG